ncbi:hypothetical protein ACFCVO_15915 [Agromyces sp. NPDC056379]|uniref:hypothetical protein n=1 Tax=unclassified Agromyces TaxID=2639701 RepID=UPI0035DD9EBE
MTTKPTPPSAATVAERSGAAQLEQRMQAVFGRSVEDYEQEVAEAALPRVFLELAHKVVTASSAPDMLARWKDEARKSNAGAKPLVPMAAVLILFVAHALAGKPLTYYELARTLRLRLKHDQRVLLGVSHKSGTHNQWYDRMWAAVNRLIELVDPYPGPRNKKLRGSAWEEYRRTTEQPRYVENSERMLERFDELVNSILRACIDLLPRDIWTEYDGGLIIDATKIIIAGSPNSSSKLGDRSNPDPLSGRYRREGKHDGKGASTDVAAYELETALTMWNKPGESTRFPTLVTAVSMHRPGQLIGHAARLIAHHKRLGFDRFLLGVDRAYNGEKIENFHIPARLAGAELILDYKAPDLGLQGWFEDLILVDGNWYTNWMPDKLVSAGKKLRVLKDEMKAARGALKGYSRSTSHSPEQLELIVQHERLLAEGPSIRAELEILIANRTRYRMKEHGHVDSDGAQRFRYPDPKLSLVTPRPIANRSSITIPMLVPEREAPSHLSALVPTSSPPKAKRSGSPRKPQPIKHVQKFAYESLEWNKHKGMRSLVEASNRLLKKATKFDIEEPDLRSGRGYAFTYLASALAVVADNIHRIRSFFHADAERTDAPKTRARRRKDANGSPLPRRQPLDNGPPR